MKFNEIDHSEIIQIKSTLGNNKLTVNEIKENCNIKLLGTKLDTLNKNKSAGIGKIPKGVGKSLYYNTMPFNPSNLPQKVNSPKVESTLGNNAHRAIDAVSVIIDENTALRTELRIIRDRINEILGE